MTENPHSAATCIITGSVNDDKTTNYKAVAAAAKSRQSCPTLWDPKTAAHQAPPSLGFSRQENQSGLPLPFP